MTHAPRKKCPWVMSAAATSATTNVRMVSWFGVIGVSTNSDDIAREIGRLMVREMSPSTGLRRQRSMNRRASRTLSARTTIAGAASGRMTSFIAPPPRREP